MGSMVLPLVNASYMSRANVTPSSLCSIPVKDIIPLGGPPHHRAVDRGRAHPVPQSQETNKKHAHTLKPLNPLLLCTLPHKTSVPERKNVPMRKVQFNNNNNNSSDNNNHLNNGGSCQSAGKKDAPLQRQGSYDKQKEFALAFCKQLNENLKVTKRESDIPQIM